MYETSYKPKCSVTYSEACKTVYVTDYKTDYKEKCYTAYQSVCEKTYRTEYKEECSTDYVKECSQTYKEECSTTYTDQCYGYGYHKKCHKESQLFTDLHSDIAINWFHLYGMPQHMLWKCLSLDKFGCAGSSAALPAGPCPCLSRRPQEVLPLRPNTSPGQEM